MEIQKLKIESVQQALTILSSLKNATNQDDIYQVIFSENFSQLKIKVVGEKYHGSFPSTFARQLWAIQEEIYRAALYSLGREENINKLSVSEKEGFLVTFHVQEGCTELSAIFENFFKSLDESLKSMDSKHKAITMIAIALILTSGYVANDYLNARTNQETQVSNQKIELDKEREKTEQFKIIAEIVAQDKNAKRFAQAAEFNKEALIKGASDADEISIGAHTYDREDIENMQKRSPKASSEEKVINGDFLVSETDFRDSDSTKYTLKDKNGKEFTISVDHSKFKDVNVKKLINAASNRAKVRLSIKLYLLRGSVKSAELLSVN